MMRSLLITLSFAAALVLAAPARAQQPAEGGSFTLTSNDFIDGGALSPRYTCEKDGVSPPLHWENVPEHVKTYVLTVDDPDAPNGDHTHWILYNMPDNTRDLAAGASAQPGAGVKADQGMNSDGKPGWAPPCPPSGEHHYIFTLYALDADISLSPGTTLDKKALMAAISGHVLGQSELTARYSHH